MPDQWQHVAVVFDGNESSAYADGDEDGITVSRWITTEGGNVVISINPKDGDE